MNLFFKHIEIVNQTIEYDKHFLLSNFLLELSHKINLFTVCSLICIGFLSNIGLVSVLFYKQTPFHTSATTSIKIKKKNKNNLPFICLLINDNIYLIFHFLDETLKTYEDIYMKSLVGILNKNQFMCRFFAYLRNSLRFSSTYLIVGLILHHFFISSSMISTSSKFKTKKRIDFKIILFLWFFALAFNIWIPFFFNLHNHDDQKILCDIVGRLRRTYFRVNLVYILLTMILPCLIILIVNTLVKKNQHKNKNFTLGENKPPTAKKLRVNRRGCGHGHRHIRSSIKLSKISSDSNVKPKLRSSLSPAKNSLPITTTTTTLTAATSEGCQVTVVKKKTVSLNMVPQIITIPSSLPNQEQTKANRYKKMLRFISYMHVAFNTPFIIVWTTYFFKMSFYGLDSSSENYMFALIKLTEIFCVFNYSFKIYIAWFLR